MQIVIDVPDQCFLNEGPPETGRRIKLYTALFMYQSGQLSAGAACELAEVDRYTFLAECGKHGMPAIDYEENELRDEFARLSKRMS